MAKETPKLDLAPYPTLARLVANGLMWWVANGACVGRAADGYVVTLGSIHDLPRLERYLVDHPTPDNW